MHFYTETIVLSNKIYILRNLFRNILCIVYTV